MILPFSVPVFPFLVLRVGTFPVLLDPAIQTDGLLREFQPGHGGLRRAQVPALAALIDQLAVKDAQLAKKDEQIAKLMETVADSTKAVQGAQVLHHETAQALALESTEQKLSRWQRLKRAWRG